MPESMKLKISPYFLNRNNNLDSIDFNDINKHLKHKLYGANDLFWKF